MKLLSSKMTQINNKPVKAGTLRFEIEPDSCHNKLVEIYNRKEATFLYRCKSLISETKNAFIGIISAI